MRRAFTQIVSTVALLLLIFCASRAIIRALPGTPLDTLIAESGTRFSSAELTDSLHLNEPFFPATFKEFKNALRFEWGESLLTQDPIAPILKTRWFHTLELSGLALLLTLLISIPMGLLGAANPGGFWDHACSAFGALFASLPISWLGPILIIVWAVWIPIFPIDHDIVLPTICLALGLSSLWIRLIRSRVRESLALGAAPGARARGIPEWKVLLKYGLAPASGALIAFLGTQFGILLGGATITETIFNWPGLGSLLVDSVLKRDYPVVEATVFVTASMCLLGNRLGEFVQRGVDPRLESEK